jgi:hypothetical protein
MTNKIDFEQVFCVKGSHSYHQPESSEWNCHLFGSDPALGGGLIYTPIKGRVPNWFVRWMMKICLGCCWVKNKETK